MRRISFVLSFLAAACFLALPVPAKSLPHRMPAAGNELEVKVRLTQCGGVPDEVQKIAEKTVRQLFSRIGVSVRFMNEAPPADIDAIALRFWDRAPRGLERYVLGSALIGVRDTRQVNAFYDRLREFSGSTDPRENGVLLGYVIAHELGHVLRSESGHSLAGIMKACWSQRDHVSMLQRTVSFSRDDADRIFAVMAGERLVLERQGER